LEGGRVDRDLVGAEVQDRLGVRERADAAGDAERDVQDPRDAIDPAPIDRSPVGACRDVVEHELVRALVPIALRELENVAHHAVVAELHALHDLAVTDVEARDDSLRQHVVRFLVRRYTYARISSGEIRPSSSALPEIAPATPVVASAARSAASRTPPDACTASVGHRRAQSA